MDGKNKLLSFNHILFTKLIRPTIYLSNTDLKEEYGVVPNYIRQKIGAEVKIVEKGKLLDILVEEENLEVSSEPYNYNNGLELKKEINFTVKL